MTKDLYRYFDLPLHMYKMGYTTLVQCTLLSVIY